MRQKRVAFELNAIQFFYNVRIKYSVIRKNELCGETKKKNKIAYRGASRIVGAVGQKVHRCYRINQKRFTIIDKLFGFVRVLYFSCCVCSPENLNCFMFACCFFAGANKNNQRLIFYLNFLPLTFSLHSLPRAREKRGDSAGYINFICSFSLEKKRKLLVIYRIVCYRTT